MIPPSVKPVIDRLTADLRVLEMTLQHLPTDVDAEMIQIIQQELEHLDRRIVNLGFLAANYGQPIARSIELWHGVDGPESPDC